MSSYATAADFTAYVEGWVTDDAAALDRLLERATRDVDNVLGPLYPRTSGPFLGLKLNPAEDLTDVGAAALARAVCAQAEHRYRNPALFTGERLAKSVKGPDFETTFADPPPAGTGRLAPAVRDELAPLAYLRAGGARARP